MSIFKCVIYINQIWIMYTYKYCVKYTELFIFFYLCINGIITIAFFASDIRHHLPFLCSVPTPAISWFPSGVKVSAFIKPVSLISNNKFKDLKPWPHCHNLITPFRDPKNHNIKKRKCRQWDIYIYIFMYTYLNNFI